MPALIWGERDDWNGTWLSCECGECHKTDKRRSKDQSERNRRVCRNIVVRG